MSEKLFDDVILIALEEQEDGRMLPCIKYRFPEREDSRFAESIVQFCFPDVNVSQKSSSRRHKSETFSFVLTETTGDRRFGYCRRMMRKDPQTSKRRAECICITTFYPCYSVFCEILDEVEVRLRAPSFAAVTFFVEAILDARFPAPGETTTVSVCSWDEAGKVDDHSFTRPDDNDSQLAYVKLEPLLRALDARNLLLVFGALLAERRIVFVSADLPTLTSAVQACVALLYPFSWQHIFIPVLPLPLLSFCCAPMPFVVGVLAGHLPELDELPMDETLMVDLDANRMLRVPFPDRPNHDYELLDPFRAAPLLRGVAESRKLCEKKGKSLPSSAALQLTDEFLRFIISQIAHFKEFSKSGGGNDDDDDDGFDFDKAGFVASVPSASRRLAEILVGSQMFEQFVQQTAAQGLPAASNAARCLRLFLEEERDSKRMQHEARSHVISADQSGIASSSSPSSSSPSSPSTSTPSLYAMLSDEGDGSSSSSTSGASDDAERKALRSGWMRKLSTSNAAKRVAALMWARRYFVLDNASLRYYKSEGAKAQAGAIDMSAVESVCFTDKHDKLGIDASLICIELTTAARSWYLHAERDDEAEHWLALFKAIVQLNQGTHSAEFASAAANLSSSSSERPTSPPGKLKISGKLNRKLSQTTVALRSPNSLTVPKSRKSKTASHDFSNRKRGSSGALAPQPRVGLEQLQRRPASARQDMLGGKARASSVVGGAAPPLRSPLAAARASPASNSSPSLRITTSLPASTKLAAPRASSPLRGNVATNNRGANIGVRGRGANRGANRGGGSTIRGRGSAIRGRGSGIGRGRGSGIGSPLRSTSSTSQTQSAYAGLSPNPGRRVLPAVAHQPQQQQARVLASSPQQKRVLPSSPQPRKLPSTTAQVRQLPSSPASAASPPPKPARPTLQISVSHSERGGRGGFARGGTRSMPLRPRDRLGANSSPAFNRSSTPGNLATRGSPNSRPTLPARTRASVVPTGTVRAASARFSKN
jgi:DENN (AEX-3) domain/uDENN domain/PH domain/dDENN domain